MNKKFNKPERELDVLKTVKSRKKKAQQRIFLRALKQCIKCDTDEVLNTNGLCAACQNGKRHGSKG